MITHRSFIAAASAALLLTGCSVLPLFGSGSLAAPYGLTVEYRINPVGIDTPAPRFSWKLAAADPAAKALVQTAYRIRVASSLEVLESGKADLWDSGRVKSDRQLNIVYAGSPLVTSQRAWWTVRVWSNAGDSSPWSEPAHWIQGIMSPEDWQAKWIGANAATRPDFDLHGAEWIWNGEGEFLKPSPRTNAYVRTFSAVTNGSERFLLAMTLSGSGHAFLNGERLPPELRWRYWTKLESYNPGQMIFTDITPFVREGENVLVVQARHENKNKPGGLLLALTRGSELLVKSDASWRVVAESNSPTNDADWASAPSTPAVAACAADDGPWGHVERRFERVSPAFRKTFPVAAKPIASATLHITGIGFYEASLNGRRIGDKVLDPSPTRYDRRVLYSTYDLTDALSAGTNTLDVLLGHGWFDVRSVADWDDNHASWRNFPRMIAQLEIVYSDGTREKVVSDGTWRQIPSPIGFDCVREGEVIGMAPPGAPDLERTVMLAAEVPGPGGKLVAEAQPPAEVIKTLAPVTMTQPQKKDAWLVDFGQHMSGWIRLTLRGQKRGNVVLLKYGEFKGGGLADYFFQIPGSSGVLPGGWIQTDRYVCSGEETETYEPRFTYNGFRYVRIEGLASKPTLDDIHACVVSTGFRDAGSFTCSNDLLNKLQQGAWWAYRSNFADGVPTDCPGREKNGWTGDAMLAAEMAMYNFENTAGYEKWIQDMVDAQRPDGNFSAVVPFGGFMAFGNGPAWNSALVVIPWFLYVYKGDARILENAYPDMKRYVDFEVKCMKNGISSRGLGDWKPWTFWTPERDPAPTPVIATGYCYLDVRILSRAATLLGKTEDAEYYETLAGTIRDAFNREFAKDNGVYASGMQTVQSCALHQDLVPEKRLSATRERLVESVLATGQHPDFGIHGSKYVFRALSDAGRTDLAYAMLARDDTPSFGEWIKADITALGDNWIKRGTASYNHVMFGDFSAWLYQYLGGIRLDPSVSAIAAAQPPADAVAFKCFLIAPDPVKGLDWVKASHESPYGLIRSEWRQSENGTFELDVTVPVNTEATVVLPAGARPGSVPEGAAAVTSPLAKRSAFRVGSGTYRFQAVLPVQSEKGE